MISKWTVAGALSLSSLAFAQAAAQEPAETGVLVQVAPLAEEAVVDDSKDVWFQAMGDPAEEERVFSPNHWLSLLSDADLDVRMRNFDRIVQLAHHDPQALKWLQDRADDTVDPELSWTAKLALREVKRHGGFLVSPKANSNIGGQFQFHSKDGLLNLRSFDLDALRGLGLQGGSGTSQSKSVQLESSSDGVKVVVTEVIDGDEKTTEYEAESLEALLEAHPELEGSLGAGGGRFNIGLMEDAIIDLDGLRLELDHSFDNLIPSGGLRRIFRGIPRDLMFDVDLFGQATPQHSGELRTDLLGVYVVQLTPEQLQARGGDLASGIYVEAIAPGTLAEKLGIAVGDFLLSINGVTLRDADMIGGAMRARAADEDLVIVGVGPDGKEWTKTWSPPVPHKTER